MKKSRLRSSLLIVGGAAVIPVLSAAPVPIDSESAAKAALVVPIHAASTVPNDLLVLAGGAQRVAELALARLNTVATPAQLSAASTGLEVQCPHAGKFLARATAPKTIAVTFTNCSREQEGLVWDWTGEAEIVLTSDSFAPNSVASIRLGSLEQDLLEKFYFLDSPASFSLSPRNLRISGRIPVARDEGDFEFYGPFTYYLTGFLEHANTTRAPDGTAGKFGLRYAAEGLAVSGHRNEWRLGNVQIFDFVTEYASGSLSQTFFDTLAGVSDTRAVTFDGLEVDHRIYAQGNDNIATLKVNGNIDISWGGVHGSGCRSGGYQLRTTRPLIFINDPGNYAPDDGELRMNDVLVARFSSRPETTIRLNVRNVGNFRYHDSITGVISALPCAW